MNGKMVLVGDFGTIGSNGTFTQNFALEGAYKDIFLLCKNSAGAPVAYGSEISSVGIIAGTENIISATPPAVLDSLNLYFNAARGAAAVTGVIPLDLTPNGLFNEIDEAAYMLGTRGVSSLKCQIKTGTLSGVASVEVWATHFAGVQNGIDFDAMGLGRHIRLSVETQEKTGTGEKEFTRYPYVGDRGVGLVAVAFANASGTGTVRAAKVERGNESVEIVPVAVDQANQRQNFRTPQSNYAVKDFALGNSQFSFLPISNATRLKSTVDWSIDPAASQEIYILTLHGINEQKGA